jgi:hypothetical protein
MIGDRLIIRLFHENDHDVAPDSAIVMSLRWSYSPPHQFRSEFKVHGIEVIPFATPDETMLFEDVNYALWYGIAVCEDYVFIRAITYPLPIM